jgi:hypothetical protein
MHQAVFADHQPGQLTARLDGQFPKDRTQVRGDGVRRENEDRSGGSVRMTLRYQSSNPLFRVSKCTPTLCWAILRIRPRPALLAGRLKQALNSSRLSMCSEAVIDLPCVAEMRDPSISIAAT